MNKDHRQLLREVKAAGYDVGVAKSGHVKIRRGGRTIATIAGSPGRGNRSNENARALLRRLGVIP